MDTTRRAVAVAILLFLPANLVAKEWDPAQRWRAVLKATEGQLATGAFNEALRPLQELTQEMLDVLGSSSDGDQFFALAVTQLALAEAGTNRTDEAIWHWQAAQNINRSLSTLDLSMYGEPGRLLMGRRLPPKPEECAHRADGIPAPVVAKRVDPRFPKGARLSRTSGIVIVQVQIDERGKTSDPQVMKPFPATLIFSTLEALREWQFVPYVNSGTATSRTFCVTLTFKIWSPLGDSCARPSSEICFPNGHT